MLVKTWETQMQTRGIFQSSSFIKTEIPLHIRTFVFFIMYFKSTVWPRCVTFKAFSEHFMLSDWFPIINWLMIKLLVSNTYYKAIMSMFLFLLIAWFKKKITQYHELVYMVIFEKYLCMRNLYMFYNTTKCSKK